MFTHLLRIFHCTDPIRGAEPYNGKTAYLYADLSEPCYSQQHNGARAIVFIFLFTYIIAVPALIYWVTVRNKDRMDHADFRAMYGFIFLGYEKDSAWWEILVLARKLALVAVLVFASSDKFLQSFFALFVLMVAMVAQQYRQPFTKKELNRMELFGIFALVLTQLISMAYFWVDSHGLKKSPSEKESITLWTTVLLLAINVDAVLVFAGHIGVASVSAAKRWCAWLCNLLRCRGNTVEVAPTPSAKRAAPTISSAEPSVANLVQGPQHPGTLARIRTMEDELDAKKGTHRPPIPGLETLCFLVERAYRQWKPKQQPKHSGKEETVANRGSGGRVAALARFRKAGQTVISMQRVTTLLHQPGLGRAAAGARTSAEAKLHRLASVKMLQSLLTGSETGRERRSSISSTTSATRRKY